MNAPSEEVSSSYPNWAQLRESKGVSLDDIAAQTNIPVSKLKAIESGQFDKLGTPTFVFGYIRRYAKILDENPGLLIQQYQELFPPEGDELSETKTEEPILIKKESPGILSRISFVQLVVVVLVVWGGLIFFTDEKVEPDTPNAEVVSTEAEEQADQTQTISLPSEESHTDTSALNDESSTSQAVELPNNALPSSAADESLTEGSLAPATEAPSTEPPVVENTQLPEHAQLPEQEPSDESNETSSETTEDALVFTFDEDCWVRVEDASGRVLIAELKRKGDNLQIFGQAPFSVLLGNARAVTLTANGRAVSTRPSGNKKTIRLTVDGGF